jgi:hypothetical protein
MSYDSQSETCQLKDWNRHKYNCSVLPPEGLTRATITCDEEMQFEVDRITSLLKRWKSELPEEKSKGLKPNFNLAARLPEAKAILGAFIYESHHSNATDDVPLDLKIPERFHYSRLPPDHKKFPYRVPLMLITRLFLLHLIATLSDEMLVQFRDYLGRCTNTMPSSMAQVFPPKVFSRPADLSPGEYDTLARLFGTMITANGDPFNCDREKKWFTLATANVYLYEASKSEVEKAPSFLIVMSHCYLVLSCTVCFASTGGETSSISSLPSCHKACKVDRSLPTIVLNCRTRILHDHLYGATTSGH